jgi:23S rRNA pseudouridine1911/1915/1917 synthase
VTNALRLNLKISALADAASPHPVHRLDYATTGVLLVGKTQSSIRALNKAFENKEIAKTYYAATIGEMEPNGEISHQVDNKESLSFFSVCNTVDSVRFNKLNLVKLEPKTG